MVLYTNDNKKYEIKWAEYWDENKRVILAKTIDNAANIILQTY